MIHIHLLLYVVNCPYFRDSSEEEPKALTPKEIKKSKWRKWFLCSKCCKICCPEGEEEKDTIESKPWKGKKDAEDKYSSDEDDRLLKEEPYQMDQKDDEINKTKDSDYYSSDNSTDYSYSYQYDKGHESQPVPIVTPFKDVEKQEVPDYASMSSFGEGESEFDRDHSKLMLDKATATVLKRSTGTVISGTKFEEIRRGRKVEFIDVPEKTKETVRRKKRKKKPRTGEERPLLGHESCSCTSSDTDDSGRLHHLQSPVLTMLKSSSSFISPNKESPSTLSSEDKGESSSISAVGTETKSDIRHAKDLIPHLDLSHVQRIPIDNTSSSLDSEIKFNHQYIKMTVPELDLSTLSSTPRYVSDIFGNVKYDEVSESPKSTSSSSRQHTTSSDISSTNRTPKDNSFKPRPTPAKVTMDRGVPDVSKTKIDVGITAKPLDRYRLEEKQKKRVKQYYKAVKDMPYKRAEEKSKSGKFMKLVQKIMPKVTDFQITLKYLSLRNVLL